MHSTGALAAISMDRGCLPQTPVRTLWALPTVCSRSARWTMRYAVLSSFGMIEKERLWRKQQARLLRMRPTWRSPDCGDDGRAWAGYTGGQLVADLWRRAVLDKGQHNWLDAERRRACAVNPRHRAGGGRRAGYCSRGLNRRSGGGGDGAQSAGAAAAAHRAARLRLECRRGAGVAASRLSCAHGCRLHPVSWLAHRSAGHRGASST